MVDDTDYTVIIVVGSLAGFAILAGSLVFFILYVRSKRSGSYGALDEAHISYSQNNNDSVRITYDNVGTVNESFWG